MDKFFPHLLQPSVCRAGFQHARRVFARGVDERQEQTDFVRSDVEDISFFSAASFFVFYQFHRFSSASHPPNKSPEPTARVAAGQSRTFGLFHIFCARWLNFGR